MKTTVREFNEMVERRSLLNRAVYKFEDMIRSQTNTLETDQAMDKSIALVKKMEVAYFDLIQKAIVNYWIGGRQYWGEVTKVGAQYFLRGEKMTKSRGFRSITEVEEITESNRDSMMSDSYYY